MRWEGEVYADGGPHTMGLRTDGRAALIIDGTSVLTMCRKPLTVQTFFARGGYSWAEATVDLTPGWHPVRIDLMATGNANGLEWRWTRPGGVTEIVPPHRLRHSVNFDATPASAVALPETIKCPSP